MSRTGQSCVLVDQKELPFAELPSRDDGGQRTPASLSSHFGAIQWDFPERVAHSDIEGLHPYPAKFIAELPRALLTILPVPPGTAVLDPFCGSGTTLVECQRRGVPSFGIDLNPIACLMARVKTAPVPAGLPDSINAVLMHAQTMPQPAIPKIPNLDHWFLPQVQASLARLTAAIANTPALHRDLLRLAVSSIIVRVSNQESDTRYAAVSKHVTSKNVFSGFLRAAQRIGEVLSARTYGLSPATVLQADTQASSYADLPWWKVFRDPQLQDLIHTALKNNYNLLLAAERINAARAQLGITRSNQFPQVSANPDFSGGKNSETIKSNIFSVAADASFQLDFFGRFRRATEAARAQLLGTEDAQKTVVLTLVSDVASDYFQLRDLDLQLRITEDTVKTQENSVRLTGLRLKHGVATRLDVLQARQVLDTANAQIPDLQRQIGQTEDAINILLGNYPQGVPRGRPLGTETAQGWEWTETLPPQLPPGLPSSLLERRPDIREAEQSLIAANADIGVAKAAFFPQISLTGSGGGALGHPVFFGASVPANTGIWSYEASLAQPLFEGGYLRNNLRYAKSQYRQALISYKQTIQQAFGDVSDALIGYQKYHQVRVRQEEFVSDLQQAVRVSLMRYRGGTATYLDVLESQRSLFNAELTLAQARNNEYQSLVELYKALGGGWQT